MALYIFHLISAAIVFLFGIFVLLKDPKRKTNSIFFLFSFSISCWLFSSFIAYMAPEYTNKLFWFKISYIGIIFIAATFYHFISDLLKTNYDAILLKIGYSISSFFVILLAFDKLVIGLYNYKWGYYPKVYPQTHIFFLISFCGLFTLAMSRLLLTLLKKNSNLSPLERARIKYLCVGGFIGTVGSIDFLPNYGVHTYPLGFIFMLVLYSILGYAVYKFHLLDIRIAFTRIGIFGLVYALVLGIPFGMVILGKYWLINSLGDDWFWAPMISLLVLATAGPFLYLFFQRKAENALLQEERRIQDLLSRASIGMRTIRSLPKLLDLIIDILAKSLRLDNAAIYLHEPENNQYVLKAARRDRPINADIVRNDPLIKRLEETKYPLVYDELKLSSESQSKGEDISEIVRRMGELKSSVIIPTIVENILLGFIVLGERKDKRVYSTELINVLSIVGNQAALAIENCRYIQHMHEEGLAERMISLDHMASSMAHEIDNPMHIIRQSLTYIRDFLLKDARVSMPPKIQDDFMDTIYRGVSAGDRVSDMIKAVLEYSRMGEGKLESIRINEALEGFMHLIQPQIKTEGVHLSVDIEDDLPLVLGDKVQMEEIFMNFVRNSMHAVRLNEEKKVSLKIFKKNDNTIRIECSDNGYGIPKEIIKDIFLASTTTKGSSEGTGLGLYRVRKIVDLFRAKVWAESDGIGKGATLIVELPIYETPK